MPLWSSLASTLAVATTLVSASSHPNAMHSSRTTRSLDRRGATLTGQYETQVLSKDYLVCPKSSMTDMHTNLMLTMIHNEL